MILDVMVVLIVLISGFIGIKKGMISILVKLIGFILAGVLACTCYESLANYLYENYTFGQKINENVKEFIAKDVNSETEEQEYINLTNILNKFKLEEKIDLKEEEKGLETGVALSDVVAEKITGYIMNIIAFIGLFLAVIIASAIIAIILSAVCLIPGLKEINKTGGFVVEIILSVLKLWVVLGIISLLSPMNFMSWIVTQIEKSIIVDFLYNNNLLVGIISRIKI